jgi:hypothetical protein
VPADDARGNFVADRKGQDGRVIGKLGHTADDLAADAARQTPVVEKCHVLEPRQSHHETQAVPCGFVDEIPARRCVSADGIDAERRHHPKVLRDAFYRRELIPVGVGGKRAVRDALDEESLVADAQKFPVSGDADLQCEKSPGRQGRIRP